MSREWQPIETAPIDWSDEGEVDLWVTHRGGGLRFTDCRASLCNGKPDWQTRSDDGWTRVYGTPTHWMKRPDPPSEETS